MSFHGLVVLRTYVAFIKFIIIIQSNYNFEAGDAQSLNLSGIILWGFISGVCMVNIKSLSQFNVFGKVKVANK